VGDLFSALSSTPATAAVASDRAWVQAMLDAEASLARACASAGLIPEPAAEAIGAACSAERFDVERIRDGVLDAGSPVIPLLEQLRALVPPDVVPSVHCGATSQDIVDTALVLVLRRGVDVVAADLLLAAAVGGTLAQEHRHTPMAARTLLQPAEPITFGLKAAGWLVSLLDGRDRLLQARSGLAAQLGGAAGTLAAYGSKGPKVAAHFAADLGLPEPVLPWHSARGRLVEVAAALGMAAGACDKVALDTGLLGQGEVGEVRERPAPGRGGSSAMPHKHNPVGALRVRVAARRAAAAAGALIGAMAHEHERALGAWQAEWETYTDLLLAAGAAAEGTAELLGSLEVDPGRMAANLKATLGDDTPDLGSADLFVARALAVLAEAAPPPEGC
jgi:3-carboxy-cis,cis-muconate cycloisomerase